MAIFTMVSRCPCQLLIRLFSGERDVRGMNQVPQEPRHGVPRVVFLNGRVKQIVPSLWAV